MPEIVTDFAHACRLLRRNPAFAAFAVATLAIGMGAATLVFSLVHAALLRSLPAADPDALVWMYNARTERDRAPFSVRDLEDYRRENTTLADFAVFINWGANLTGTGSPERLEGTRVSGNFFDVLGSRPLIGRTLQPQDERDEARVAVMTHGLWSRRFGRDPGILGSDIVLNGARYTVVGVMLPDFMFPFRQAELAIPIALRGDARRADRGANFLRVVARLRHGITLAAAKADLDAIARRLQQAYPEQDSRKTGVNLYPLHEEIVRDYRQILWTLFAAVALFLLIGIGNLANLLFVRSIGRAPEFALRTSLGASRSRIVRQLVAEAGVLAILGGMGGVAVANGGIFLWRILGPADFPRRETISLNPAVLFFTLGASILAAFVCSLLPASGVREVDPIVAGRSARSLTGSRRDARARRGFVAAQFAGAIILLVFMGLAARAFGRLERVPTGFTQAHALSLQLSLPPGSYNDTASIERFCDRLSARFDSVGGVRAAGAISLRPLSGLLSATDVWFPDRPPPPPNEVPQAHFRIVTPGYFEAAGIAVIAGRDFTAHDRSRDAHVAIVSRTFAARHWPAENAVGKSITIMPDSPSSAMQVVGVVSDVKQFGLDGPPTADLYVPLSQMPASQAALVAARLFWIVRTDGDPAPFARQVREIVQATDPDVATSSIQTLDEVVDASLAGWRVNVRLLEAFGQLAVLLVALGVYAVASYSATTRRRELAIRTALGATGRELVRLIVFDELRPLALGLAIGLTAALLTARQLGSLLFDTSALDPWPYALGTLGLLIVGIVASYLPARRAGRTSPGELLRVADV